MTGSYAIDTGTCTGAPSKDQRGVDRPDISKASFCDIGAYESDEYGVANLQISKVVNAANTNPGQTITYTVAFTNSGPAPTIVVTITDDVPVTLTNVTSTSSGVALTPIGGSKYGWTIAELPNALNSGAGIITITGQISENLTIGGRFTNTASIAGLASDTQTSDVGVTINEADLALTKAKTGTPTTVSGVTTITYTVTISNPSATPATGVVVSDTLSSGVNLVSSNTTVGSYDAGVWNVGDVGAGGSAVLTLVVTTTLGAGERITNTAAITDLVQVDPNLDNNDNLDNPVVVIIPDSGPGPVYLPIILKAAP